MTRPAAETRPVELSPPCTSCGEPVDLRRPHVTIVIAVQTHRSGRIFTHADRTLGTWHKPCSRSWPVPLQRSAPTEEDR